MDLFAASSGQPRGPATMPAPPAGPSAAACGSAAWIVSDPQGGELPACEADLDVLLNDALSRVPPHSRVRVEVWRA
jgi:hypothetical protein